MRILAGVAVLAAVLLAAGTNVSAAAPNKATLTVTPSPAHAGDYLVFSGCGYQPGVGVEVEFTSPTAIGYFGGGTADASGCFNSSGAPLYATGPGGWEAYTYQNFAGHHPQIQADLDFTVLP